MLNLKTLGLFGVFALLATGCGGGGGETPVSFDPNAPVSGQSEYDRQTTAARARFNKSRADALSAAESWLDANRREPGVITTQSGLQYRVDAPTPNPSGQSYAAGQTVTVHYEGQLVDGTVFNSSFERGRPEELVPDELILGWQEALTLMHPGDEWTLFIPPALGYGDVGKAGSVPPNAVTIFRVQLR